MIYNNFALAWQQKRVWNTYYESYYDSVAIFQTLRVPGKARGLPNGIYRLKSTPPKGRVLLGRKSTVSNLGHSEAEHILPEKRLPFAREML